MARLASGRVLQNVVELALERVPRRIGQPSSASHPSLTSYYRSLLSSLLDWPSRVLQLPLRPSERFHFGLDPLEFPLEPSAFFPLLSELELQYLVP